MEKLRKIFLSGLALLALVVAGCKTETPESPSKAQQPKITQQPQSAEYVQGDKNVNSLSVTAEVSDGGELSYQWYKEGEAIKDGRYYKPDVSEVGNSEYYCVVTNTLGSSKVSVESDHVTIKVTESSSAPNTDVASVNITVSPVAKTDYVVGDVAVALKVEATAEADPDKNILEGTLTYQWYKNTTASNEGGEEIENATSASYTPVVSVAGTVYYYVIVTATNTSATGNKTSSKTSQAVEITVKEADTNVAKPIITVQPQSKIDYKSDDEIESLSVTATANADTENNILAGTLTYQWYRNTTASNVGGTKLNKATGENYKPSIETNGTYYYYVVVTATNNEATGEKTKETVSDVVKIIVTADGIAKTVADPVITKQPDSKTDYEVGNSAVALKVEAKAEADEAKNILEGTLTYQWYKNTTASTENGTSIADATSASYIPDISKAGTVYYYVVVTATNDSAIAGAKTSSKASDVVTITVAAPVLPETNVAQVKITTHPTTASYSVGDKASELKVVATAAADPGNNILEGTLSYQWMKNSSNSTTGGTVIEGATNASYTPDTSVEGTYYYYVVVTAKNDFATGKKETVETSSVAVIKVNALEGPATPVFKTNLDETKKGEGSVELTVEASATKGTVTYQLFKDGVASGEAKSSGTFTVEESGKYYIQAISTLNGKTLTQNSVECAVTIVEEPGSGSFSFSFGNL